MNDGRFIRTLVDLYRNHKFTGIIKQNLSKMGLTKTMKVKKQTEPISGTSFAHPLEIFDVSDEGIEITDEQTEASVNSKF